MGPRNRSKLPSLLIFALATGAHAQLTPLKIAAEAGVIIEAKSGAILWEKNPDKRMYPASTTKIMTGLLLAESVDPTEEIVCPGDVNKVGESSLNLRPGEILTARDMLKGLMLRSANDGCYSVAIHISGSVKAFADRMNTRAKDLGCFETQFVNPNGLPDSNHYTTARDLATIAREAMKNDLFREVVRMQTATISRTKNTKDVALKNRNSWLAKDASADGIKTGYTRAAGHCFVGSATRDGWQVITVLLKSSFWEADQQAMVDWAFTNYGIVSELDLNASVLNGTVASVSLEPVPGGVVPKNVAIQFDPIRAPVSQKMQKSSTIEVDGMLLGPFRFQTSQSVLRKPVVPAPLALIPAGVVSLLLVSARTKRK